MNVGVYYYAYIIIKYVYKINESSGTVKILNIELLFKIN